MTDTQIIPSVFNTPRPPRDASDTVRWSADFTQAFNNAMRTTADRTNAMIAAGLFAERPTSDGSRRFFYATDTSALYLDVPAGWITVATGSLTLPLSIANGGTGSSTQNFVDLTTVQAVIAGIKTFFGNNLGSTTQLSDIFASNGASPYNEGIAGNIGDPSGALGPIGARALQLYDGSAASPIVDTGFGASNTTRPTFLSQRTTSSTAANEMSHAFTTLIKGGVGERYGLFNAVHTKAQTTTLNGGINSAVTSMVVTSSTGFPAAPFTVLIGTEFISVSVVAGTTWTIARGANASTAAAHLNGDTIYLIVGGDIVGFTASTYMEAPCTATAYAVYPRVERTVITRICGMEIDVFNSSGTDAATTDADPVNSTIGLAITCGGGKKNSIGLAFQSSGAVSAYAAGIKLGANTAYQYGVDLAALGTTPAPIRLPNAAAIVGLNAAANADKKLIQLNANDQVEIDPGGAQGTKLSGYFAVNRVGVTLANGLNSNIAAPAGTFLRIVGISGAFQVGGIVAPTGNVSTVLKFFNPFAQTMTIVNEDASSTAANRITTLTGANVTLAAGSESYFEICYDSGTARWIVTDTYPNTGSGSSGSTTTSGLFASRPAFGSAGNLYFATDTLMLYRDTGAAWESYGPLQSFGSVAPLDPGTWLNQGTSTIDTTNGGLDLDCPATAARTMRGREATYGAGSVNKWVTAFVTPQQFAGNTSGDNFVGIHFRQNQGANNGRTIQYGLYKVTSDAISIVVQENTANGATFGSTPNSYASNLSSIGCTGAWIRMRDDGTNIVFQMTNDPSRAANWVTVFTQGRAAWITAPPDVYGIFGAGVVSNSIIISGSFKYLSLA